MFKVYAKDGSYERAYYYPRKNIVLKKEDVLFYYKDSDNKRVRNEIRNDPNFPKTWPAFNMLKLDDKNRLWISTFTEDSGISEWLILGQSGKLLAKFTWPWHREIKAIKNGELYALETNEKTKLQKIVRYRIEMN